MSSDTPTTNSAPATCEGCGSILLIFEEFPDGGVIYCACRCMTEAGANKNEADRPRLAATGAVQARHATAIRERRGPKPEPVPSATLSVEAESIEPRSGGRNVVMIGAVSVVLVAALVGFWSQGGGRSSITAPAGDLAPTDAPRASLLKGGVDIVNDKSGAVMLVSGNDPGEVLRGFCRHPQFKSALVPGNIEPTTPMDPDLLLGSALLLDGTGIVHQVIMKRDPTTKRWSIGNGTTAITLGPPTGTAER